MNTTQVRIIRNIAIGTGIAAAAYLYARRCIETEQDYDDFTNKLLKVENIEELSTYIDETVGQTDLICEDVEEVAEEQDNIVREHQGPPLSLDFIARMSVTSLPSISDVDADDCNSNPKPLVGIRETDGNIKNATSIYIQDKTRVTNHRRIMYRQRNNFTNALVAQVKMSLDWQNRDAANEKVARKMIKDAMAKHGLSITDSARTLPIAITAVFLPSDAEIYANDWRRSAATQKRINRFYNGQTLRHPARWLWNKLTRNTVVPDMLTNMDNTMETPQDLVAHATHSWGTAERRVPRD